MQKLSVNSPSPSKEIDIDFLVFVERYATDLLRWDILALFGQNPNIKASVPEIAQRIGRSSPTIRPELGDLVLLGILNRNGAKLGSEPLYQLTEESQFRRMTIKFATIRSTQHPLLR